MSQALTTFSKFYYNYLVNETNQWLDYNDGSGEKSVKIPSGAYTFFSLGIEIASQMTALSGTHTFSVIGDRLTRKYTITALTGGNFSLLFDTGTYRDLSISSLIGFDDVNLSGDDSYESLNSTGSVYYPQYVLQSYVDADFNKFPLKAVVNKSSSGNNYEVVKFGSNNLYRFEIKYTTDIDLDGNSFIKDNPNGLSDLNSFMSYCTNKYPIEFMKDEALSNNFDSIVLESTPQSSDGVSYEISPDYSQNIPDFYTLGGQLVFRRVT